MPLILPARVPPRFLAFATVVIIGLTVLFRLDIYSILPKPKHAFSPIVTSLWSRLALQGYDPVAYFTQGQPVVGKAHYEFSWQGLRWHFSEAHHRDMFAAHPRAYVPVVGGYDVSALSSGQLARGDPRYWLIRQGRLLLFSSSFMRGTYETPKHSRNAFVYQPIAQLYWQDFVLGDDWFSKIRALEHERMAK